MNRMWRKFQIQTGMAEAEEQSYAEEFSEMTSLSFQQRIIGFFMSLLMGITFVAIALSFVPVIALFPKKFAFFFTCGNFFCVASTAFLVGPAKQLRSMFDAHRAQAAGVFLGAMAMTVISALKWRSSILSIVFAVIQIVAVVWYGLSYIPYARRVVSWLWSYAGVVIKPILSFIVDILWKTCRCCCGRFICPNQLGDASPV